MSEMRRDPASGKAANVGRSIATLGIANASEILVQVAIPIMLVRLLSPTEFGLYRTLWLIAGTLPSLLALGVPVSLYYFLPRVDVTRAAAFVLQSAIHMAGAGVVAAGIATVYVAFQHDGAALGLQAIVFVGLWVFASLLDFLYVARQSVPDQVRINLSFAALRVVSILGAAFVFRSWSAVLAAHLLVVVAKAAVCTYVVARQARHGQRPTLATLREQYRYALPVGGSTALYLLRGRLDQWLVATLFTAAQFGVYSIAAVFAPLQTLIRVTVNQVLQPELSRLQAQQDIAGMQALSRRSNLGVALLLFPSVAFIGFWAEEILSVLFTEHYSSAAPVVRVYLVTMAIESLDVAMVLMAMRQARFLVKVDAFALVIAIGASCLGAFLLGMPGTALGGAIGAIGAQSLIYARYSALTGVGMRAIQDWAALGRVVVAVLLAGVVSLAASRMPLPGPPVVQLLAAGLAFSAGYWVSLYLLGMAETIRQALGSRLARAAGFG
jgi:O-antigen/teichoic acid export membrane protein